MTSMALLFLFLLPGQLRRYGGDLLAEPLHQPDEINACCFVRECVRAYVWT